MNDTLVSVVMPTHNYGRFIGEAIDSILGQTYERLELIVVDDASTDNTVEIVSSYSDDRLVFIERGICSCSAVMPRNDGMAAAKGDLIAVADADDISVPDRLARQVDFLEHNVDVELVSGGLLRVCEDGRPIGPPMIKPNFDWPELYRMNMLMDRCVIYHGALMFRKRILDTLTGYGDYLAAGDTEFFLRASRYFRFYNLNKVLIHYRQHATSTTSTYGNRLRAHHHAIFLAREQLWVQRELEKMEEIGSK